MHITCSDCRQYWEVACPECAEDKADKHRANTGHDVKIVGTDQTSGSPPLDVPIRDFPTWMRGSRG